jgi:DNA (cytosine-5)-methyltransferase 1
VFVVGCLGDWESAARVLFEPESLCGDLKKSREKGEGFATIVAPSLTASNNPSRSPQSSEVTQQVYAVLQATQNKLAYAPKLAPCLETTCHDYSRADGFTMMVYETHPADSRVKAMGDVCQTVTSRWGTGGGNVPLVQSVGFTQCDAARDVGMDVSPTLRSGGNGGYPSHSVAYGFEPGISKREGNPNRFSEELSPTLRAQMGDNQAAVAYSIREDAKANNFSATPLSVTPALQALRPSVQSHHAQTFVVDKTIAQSFNVNARPDEMKLETEVSGTLTSSQNAGLFQDMAVRRLTPVECERLQGFPDNYTQIPWGKGDTPDSHRYKAMGNSMAVPCMQWIGDRIQKVENGLL